MKDDQLKFLTLLDQRPARFTFEQTAWALNFQEHDIPVLVKARLLKPLGNPPANGIKYIAAVEIAELAQDRQWLAKATNTIHTHWNTKNQRKNGRTSKSFLRPNNPRADKRTPPNGAESGGSPP